MQDLPAESNRRSYDPDCVVTDAQMAIHHARGRLHASKERAKGVQVKPLLEMYAKHEGADPSLTPKATKALDAGFNDWLNAPHSPLSKELRARFSLRALCGKTFCAAMITGVPRVDYIQELDAALNDAGEGLFGGWSTWMDESGNTRMIFARRHFETLEPFQMADALVEAGVLPP